MSDIVDELKRVSRCVFKDGWESPDLHARAGIEIAMLRARVTELRALSATQEQVPVEVGTISCPCTTFEQGEDCTVGYPSMLCSACDGKGHTTIEKVAALAAEMMKIAEQVDELEDPFAAWETVGLLQSQNEQLRKSVDIAAPIGVAVKALDEALANMDRCEHDGGFDRETGPIGCYLGDKCVCAGVYPQVIAAKHSLVPGSPQHIPALVASTPPAPVSSETVEVSECAEKIDGMLRKLEALRIAFDMKGANATTILRVVNTLATMKSTLVAAITSAQPLPVQEAAARLVIDVEKLLLKKLGREWTPAGISIVSLIDELASRHPAPSSAGVVGEWQMVPVKPTKAQFEAAWHIRDIERASETIQPDWTWTCVQIYRAMLAAAPEGSTDA